MPTVLRSNTISLEVSEINGSLLRFSSLATGWVIQQHDGTSLFNFCIPVEGDANNRVYGNDQPPPHLEQMDGGVKLTWERLRDERGETLDISFTAFIHLMDGLRFEGRIVNHSPFLIEHIAYPCMGGIRPHHPSQEMNLLSWGYAGARQAQIYPQFAGEYGYWASEFPYKRIGVPNSGFALIQTEKQGLYIGCHTTRLDYRLEHFFELKPAIADSLTFTSVYPGSTPQGIAPRVEMAPVHMPFLQPGQSLALLPVTYAPYQGQWEHGLERYKAWRETRGTQPCAPSWLNQVHSWYQVQLNSYGDGLRYQYKDLIGIAKTLKAHGIGAIQVTGWTLDGQDGQTPVHEVDPRLGTYDELKAVIGQIEAMGIRVILYCKFVFADTRTEWFRTELKDYASRDIYGDIHTFPGYAYERPSIFAGINTHRLAIMCPNHSKWREVCAKQLRICIDLGASGVLFDETHEYGNMMYCFDPSHGHAVPGYAHDGSKLLAHALKQECLAAGRPDFLLAGEAIYDLFYEDYPLSYFRMGARHAPVQRCIDASYANLVGVWGYDDRNALNLCLLNRYIISYETRNFRGLPDEFPLTLEYGKSIDRLRERYQERLWDVEMLPQDTVALSAQPGAHIAYTVYQNKQSGLKTLMIANLSDRMEEVNVELPGGREWQLVSPERPEPAATDSLLSIPARCAFVLLENES